MKKKPTRRKKPYVFEATCTIHTDEIFPRFIRQRFDVSIRSTHDIDGSPAGECGMPADSVQVRHVNAGLFADGGKSALASTLRELAAEVSGTESDFDGGRSVVIVLRNYSESARNRMRGAPTT